MGWGWKVEGVAEEEQTEKLGGKSLFRWYTAKVSEEAGIEVRPKD